MGGLTSPPAWLQTDWVLGQFCAERRQAGARYSAFVAAGVDHPSVWQGLRHQMVFSSEAFIERFTQGTRKLDRLWEAPCAQRRPLARPLGHCERTDPDRREAMGRVFLTGVYILREIADHFGEPYSTASRAVRWLEETETRLTQRTIFCRRTVTRGP